VQKETPVLRAKAAVVAASEFGTSALQKLLTHMSTALAACDDGVALAAPQIGIAKSIFIVSGKVFRENKDDPVPADLVFINSKMKKLSSTKLVMDEGCLSVRGVYGKIERSEKASVTAYDAAGNKFTRGASGLLAQIFQHEMDHLDGVLFIDKAVSVEEVRRGEGAVDSSR